MGIKLQISNKELLCRMLLSGARFFIILVLICTLSISSLWNSTGVYAQSSEELGYKKVTGAYINKALGFEFVLPDSMEGFVYEYDSENGGRSLTLQIHPEFNSSSACCPDIDTTPAALLLDSGPLNTVRTPVPFTSDLYAAIEGYNMKINIEKLGAKEVLVATLHSERNDLPGHDLVKRMGKFYFVNSDERFISYGLWASEENFAKYLDVFEESAKTVLMENQRSINLGPIFHDYFQPDLELQLDDASILHPEMITPSIIESISVNDDKNEVRLNMTEPSGNSFLIVNASGLIRGPHSITLDGNALDFVTLDDENGKYLMAFYNETGNHELLITGTSIVPEFSIISIPIIGGLLVGLVVTGLRVGPLFTRK